MYVPYNPSSGAASCESRKSKANSPKLKFTVLGKVKLLNREHVGQSLACAPGGVAVNLISGCGFGGWLVVTKSFRSCSMCQNFPAAVRKHFDDLQEASVGASCPEMQQEWLFRKHIHSCFPVGVVQGSRGCRGLELTETEPSDFPPLQGP